jgi:hypothetical protein
VARSGFFIARAGRCRPTVALPANKDLSDEPIGTCVYAGLARGQPAKRRRLLVGSQRKPCSAHVGPLLKDDRPERVPRPFFAGRPKTGMIIYFPAHQAASPLVDEKESDRAFDQLSLNLGSSVPESSSPGSRKW